MNILQLFGATEIGLIYALVAIGVYVTFRVIDFADLTVDGSFALGAAVVSAMIVAGYNPYLSTAAAIFAGCIAGMITGYLHVRWNILGLLAGILTMTALYSVNLRIMHKPNIAIIEEPTIFSNQSIIFVLICVTIASTVVLSRMFASQFGLAIRGVGINPKVSRAYGINVGMMKIIALAVSNGVVAFAGALFAQSQGFADISMGSGTVIVGLASVIIGETLFHPKSIFVALISCVIGSILYRIAIAFALNSYDIGLQASDLNLITAVLVACTMIISKIKKRG